MKRRIADWMYRFWYNNHTHNWELYEPTMSREKCRYCRKVQNLNTKTKMSKYNKLCNIGSNTLNSIISCAIS